MMNKLIILDFFLRDNKGHHEQYDFSIVSEAMRQGLEAEIWCHRRTIDHQPPFVKECLSSDFTGQQGLIKKIKDAFARMLELRDIFRKHSLDGKTLVLVQEIDSYFLLSFVLATLGVQVHTKVVILIRRSLRDIAESLGFVEGALRHLTTYPCMRRLYKRKGVVFFSDSEAVTDKLKGNGFADATTVPIPHLPPRQKRRRRQIKTVIGYFGGARYDKGFDLLPAVIENLLSSKPDVSFVIQRLLFDKSRQIREAMKRLDELADSFTRRLALLDGYLSNEEYIDNMKKCSIVLIPYRKELYGWGTSGILAEAIACGAWAVVPSGTWMSAQKSEYSKIVTFDEHTPQALLDAISKCIESEKNIDQKQLKEQIDRWYAFHCPQNYIRILQSVFQQ